MAKIVGGVTTTPIKVDHELKPDSSTPVANHVIYNEFDNHMRAINSIAQMIPTIDHELKADSNHPVSNAAITKEFDSVYGAFDDIDNALDSSIAILDELLPPALINFTIVSSEYTALKGMTWLEWVNSEYNIKGGSKLFTCDNEDDYVHPGGASHLVVRNNIHIIPIGTDKIIANGDYYVDNIG